jgi:hypothetical protein
MKRIIIISVLIFFTCTFTGRSQTGKVYFCNLQKLIKGNVEQDFKTWSKKDVAESVADYRLRMSKQKEKIEELKNNAIAYYKKEYISHINLKNYTVSEYDADNQVFKINWDLAGEFLLPVSRQYARSFKESESRITFKNVDFVVYNNTWKLSYIEVYNPDDNRSFYYDITREQGYNAKNYTVNVSVPLVDMKPYEVTENIQPQKNEAILNPSVTPDVDINIPVNSEQKENTYALIIGNEDYSSFQTGLSNEVNVDFAVNDAVIFKEYCVKTLGIREKQVKLLKNATATIMKQGLSWLNNLTKIDSGKAEIIFYYSGHGLPHEVTKQPYLIPVDVSGNNVEDGIKLADAFLKLSQYPSKKVTVFIDACFSGGARNQGLLAMKGVKIKPDTVAASGNMVAFCSSTGDESSGVYRENKHGFMTYFLLKKLKETAGDVTYKDLGSFIVEKVIKETSLESKPQTPQVLYSPRLEKIWESWRMK